MCYKNAVLFPLWFRKVIMFKKYFSSSEVIKDIILSYFINYESFVSAFSFSRLSFQSLFYKAFTL